MEEEEEEGEKEEEHDPGLGEMGRGCEGLVETGMVLEAAWNGGH